MADEVQRFDILGSPGSGKFTLSFRGATTDLIAYHPPAGDVQRALETLSTVGTGNVVVTKDGNWGYVCSFQNALGDQDLPQLEADDSQLGGGGTIEVTTKTHGYPPIDTTEPPIASLQLPVTLQRLSLSLQACAAVLPGVHHEVVVNTDGTSLLLSPSRPVMRPTS
jgi:hypothetical protein